MNVLKFFKRKVLISKIFGIPVLVDYRWFFVIILMSWLTASSIPKTLVDDILLRFVLGFATTIIFFFSIFLHELAHSLVAKYKDLEVVEIFLHPFGGLARFRFPPQTPGAEFWIAIVGPAASFLISFFFLLLIFFSRSIRSDVFSLLFFLLFFWNLLLAIFNLFPGYPLDGGRVLRAFLWKRGKNFEEATFSTGRAGQIIAVTLIVAGLIIALIRADLFTGLWTVIVGLFLLDSANGILREINEESQILVSEVMYPPVTITKNENILYFVDNTLPLHRRTAFFVLEKYRICGVLILEDLKNIDRSRWRDMKIVDAMRPVAPDYLVESNLLLEEAREIMRENGIGMVGVVNERGELVGSLQRYRVRKRLSNP